MLAWYADENHLTPTQRRAIARHLIAGRTNLPKDEVRTSPPNPILRTDGSVQGAPKYDLLRGAAADAVVNILSSDGQSQTVIAEGGKAIFLFLFPPTNDHFLALIEGLTFLNNEEEALECEAFIRRALANHSKIKQLILSKTPSVHPPIAPDAVYQDWLDSLSVTPLVIGRSGTKPDPDDIEPEEPLYDVGWHLYGRPFTELAPHQKKLQHLLGSLHLSHLYMGRADFKIQPYRCGICRGVDHPIGLCPFPELNKWFRPTLQSISRQVGDTAVEEVVLVHAAVVVAVELIDTQYLLNIFYLQQKAITEVWDSDQLIRYSMGPNILAGIRTGKPRWIIAKPAEWLVGQVPMLDCGTQTAKDGTGYRPITGGIGTPQ
ncbi:hypothetical protein EV360DRAFT_76984 [Lentinula raphanica]|nr:hypothetical protein EV360DRAFT_76984 [Lentinula raphanica]